MKHFLILLFCVPIFAMAQEGCTTGGPWPEVAFTPICDDTTQNITTGGWAGEYSPVNVIEGETYTFTSSIESDFITLADDQGETVYTTGTGSVTWTATATEELRFYLHVDADCGSESESRTRAVRCGSEPTEAPECPTLLQPQDEATGINYTGNVTLRWAPPTTGGIVSGFNIFMDTTDASTYLGQADGDAVWATIAGLEENTTYYWRVTAVNAAGESQDCEVFSFTTMSNPFPPYCGPLTFTYLTEPITRVTFAGIDNVTEAQGSSTVPHEIFLDMVAEVQAGETYPITFEGNTEGAHNNYFAVFIDWNQNGNFNDPGEQYFTDGSVYIFSSIGTDGVSVTAQITVPEDALEGTTRMRVKKDYGNFQTPANFDDPCFGGLYGQIEDYTVQVGTLSTIDVSANNRLHIYPNPTTDVINIRGAQIAQVQLYDMSGKQLRAHVENNRVDARQLLPGVYVLQIEDAEGNISTQRFIKK